MWHRTGTWRVPTAATKMPRLQGIFVQWRQTMQGPELVETLRCCACRQQQLVLLNRQHSLQCQHDVWCEGSSMVHQQGNGCWYCVGWVLSPVQDWLNCLLGPGHFVVCELLMTFDLLPRSAWGEARATPAPAVKPGLSLVG